MTSISSIDTSFYPGLIEGFSPRTMEAVPAIQKDDAADNAAAYYQGGGSSGENSEELKELFELYTIEFNDSDAEGIDEE